jgi:hypothetical protein
VLLALIAALCRRSSSFSTGHLRRPLYIANDDSSTSQARLLHPHPADRPVPPHRRRSSPTAASPSIYLTLRRLSTAPLVRPHRKTSTSSAQHVPVSSAHLLTFIGLCSAQPPDATTSFRLCILAPPD